ncbi:hypothetical protein BGZ60DRAFT_431163 [Tricladium varicosporioides]|nr:hypothetical protein BGZ60DRAFT_431163 [Hymenoscyphus varicosporioides]
MTSAPSQWYKDQFLISTSQSLLQHNAINKAFASDFMYWTKSLPEDRMKKMLTNSLCFGVYDLPQTTSEIAGRTSPKQIGLGRLITDESSFAYLTDVYLLPEYQGKGLGKWLIKCINETIESWPDMRATMLITGGEHAVKFYKDTLGMKIFDAHSIEMEIMIKKGPGSAFENL